MFKKRERPTAARQRDGADEGDGQSGGLPTATAKKPRGAALGSSAGGSNEGGRIGASTRRSDADAANLREDRSADTALSGFKASEGPRNRAGEDAVRTLETETEVGKDTRAMHERNQKIHEGLKDGTLEKGVYRGLGGYKQYAERSEGAISASKYSGLLGPTRGMSNVRSTMRIEYWAACSGTDGGICKDYKETGYCGFGDSCKFLHDRSDYKSGHVIEREWEEKQKKIEEKKRKQWEKRAIKKAEGGGEDEASDDGGSSSGSDDENELPTQCLNCRLPWAECQSIPVQTVCGHHFCEDCAMSHYSRTPKCYACDAPTHGIFNSCDALEEKVKQQKAERLERRSAGTGQGSSLYSVGRET